MIETKLTGKTPDLAEENIKRLMTLFPEVVTEGKVDFEKLKQLLGEYVDDSNERYNFTWNGKGRALRLSQTPSLGTLRPCKKESKNWETTQNLYIEGDNLEVLKLLQKSYYGKIKIIYIDPPYNTGTDFVYKDDFHDSIENYKRITGQVDGNGNLISTNPETSGRYHTDWLNMMYPRLRLARNLLSDDGVIFISIDDNEVHNLRKICDEVFGEENFVAQFVWVKKKKGSHLSRTTRSMTEYVMCYAKVIEKVELYGEDAYSDKQQPLAKRTNSIKQLIFPKNTVRTTLGDGVYKANKYGEGTTALTFKNDIIVAKGIVRSEIIVEGPFVWTQTKLDEEIKSGTIVYLSKKFGFNVLRSDQSEKIKRPPTLIDNKINVGTNEDAYQEALELFGREGIMSYPKPVSLIKFLVNTITYFNKDAIVLDFFAGSATTAHAVMQLNAEDGGKRRFIMVQLPEPVDEKSEAYEAGFKNISDIGKARICRAGEKIKAEYKDEQNIDHLDIGFKVFKLDTSNIRKWQPDYDNLEQSLFDYIDNFVEGRTELDVVFEIMLKYGLDLAYPVDEFTIAGKKVYSIGYGMLMICLDDEITTEVARGILAKIKELSPESSRVVFKDNGFKSDSNKTNIKEIFKSGGIEEFITI
ncbi:MAG TPA: site-specific DNA-methyltransferase [Clostridia bacterium]|nr:site-specific DNA-methyltransferase [Clostridia bacterium]